MSDDRPPRPGADSDGDLAEPSGDAGISIAIPESLTIAVELPAEVHETPEDERHLVIADVAVTPSAPAPGGTSSITIPPPRPRSEAPAPAPSRIPPLPDDVRPDRDAAPRTRARRPAAPTRPGRPPAPEGFWRHLVYAATLRLVNLGDSAPVRARKALDARIAKPFADGTRYVPILTRKGGVGKTTITTLLGMALSDVREDRVIAIDANPDRGTLAERVARQTRSTVRQLIELAPSLTSPEALSAHVSRDETGLEVVASDADPLLGEAFDEDGYNVVADVAARVAGVVLTDCGTGIVHSVMRPTLQRADAIVVVSGGSIDEARLASETLTWLEANGAGQLVRGAVVALNTATPGTKLARLDEIEAHFRSRVREVVRIPYDPELAAGSVIRYHLLRPFTRESARHLAAVVMDGIPTERD
ncbi:MinD/ParA family ATP-binding protein [Homoserinibacter sp. YIM 151385]|uniref:MinD/ParA family ATP-binding protein n=1 Tax=Homoserinibacter sp. YIM 151385 TaxID=2985506 RepID=UPI0022F123B8|nr:MinD/ParA family protein [Homoserinibacter sp. YIM 151385]WBU38757.1 MinD/ParA family protein [Homoserinibacter sp. YIM 151385]